jgi:hypothetical protein
MSWNTTYDALRKQNKNYYQIKPKRHLVDPGRGISIQLMKKFWSLCERNIGMAFPLPERI